MVQLRLILVPLAGLEPARMLLRGILSPLRLPIPPQRRYEIKNLCTLQSAEVFWRRHPDLNRGIKVLQTLALPLGYSAVSACRAGKYKKEKQRRFFGAGNEIRTRDIHLGKVTLYH